MSEQAFEGASLLVDSHSPSSPSAVRRSSLTAPPSSLRALAISGTPSPRSLYSPVGGPTHGSPLFRSSPRPKPPVASAPAPLLSKQASLSSDRTMVAKRKEEFTPHEEGAPKASGDSSQTTAPAATTPKETTSESTQKKTRADRPSKIMPRKYELCDVRDLTYLISNMILELVRLNDNIKLQDGHLTRFHSRCVLQPMYNEKK
jgi:hypothetical protein